MEAQGSHITYFSPFGIDPLISRDDLVQRREEMFRAKYHDFAQFFTQRSMAITYYLKKAYYF